MRLALQLRSYRATRRERVGRCCASDRVNLRSRGDTRTAADREDAAVKNYWVRGRPGAWSWVSEPALVEGLRRALEPRPLGRSATGVTATREAWTADTADSMTFEEFFRQRWTDAVRLAYVMTGESGSAEDLAQDAFSRVAPRFETLDSPWPYTRTAIVNASRSHHRRVRREAIRNRTASISEVDLDAAAASELLDVVDKLPFRQKAVIVLRYYEDLSEREIADVLGCRPGTVKSLASRALARLAQEVQR